jgi:hypothetical protein
MSNYVIDGKDYPSVTTILSVLDKPAIKKWAVKETVEFIANHVYSGDEKEWDAVFSEALGWWETLGGEARDIGQNVHHKINNYIDNSRLSGANKTPYEESGEEVKAFLAFLRFENLYIKEWLRCEYTVYSRNGYAGTLDAEAVFHDEKTRIIDFKVSSGIYPENRLQIAAYRDAYEEMTGNKIDGQGIVRLDKYTGEPEWKDTTKTHKTDLLSFQALVVYWYLLKNRRLKHNPINEAKKILLKKLEDK